MQVCYEEGLNRNRKLAGTIRAKFTIPLSGKATRVTVVSATIKDAKLSRCIKNVITQLRFPTSPNIGWVSHVTYPFHLKPAK